MLATARPRSESKLETDPHCALYRRSGAGASILQGGGEPIIIGEQSPTFLKVGVDLLVIFN